VRPAARSPCPPLKIEPTRAKKVADAAAVSTTPAVAANATAYVAFWEAERNRTRHGSTRASTATSATEIIAVLVRELTIERAMTAMQARYASRIRAVRASANSPSAAGAIIAW